MTVEIVGGSGVRFSDDNGSTFELTAVESPLAYVVAQSVADPVVMPGWSLDAVRAVAFAASDDPSRPILESINFVGPQAQATDSYRAAWHTSDDIHPIQGMIPASIVGMIEPADFVWQSADWFEWGHTGLHRRIRAVGDKFPDLGRIVPHDTNGAQLPLGPLLTACKAASAIGWNAPIELKFKRGVDIKARCRMAGASTSRVIPCHGYDGPTIVLGFNPDYLADVAAATVAADGHVAVSATDNPLRPVMFGDGPLETMLMPVRLET
ncbi:MAG: hypothetical protein GY750_13755 [Lentisphaerae bacterium]|nr:hypothetical protein [Lentisphaerota bacterium]